MKKVGAGRVAAEVASKGGGERGVIFMADLTGCVGGRRGEVMVGVCGCGPIMFVGVRGGCGKTGLLGIKRNTTSQCISITRVLLNIQFLKGLQWIVMDGTSRRSIVINRWLHSRVTGQVGQLQWCPTNIW